jgi:hypothetical protein
VYPIVKTVLKVKKFLPRTLYIQFRYGAGLHKCLALPTVSRHPGPDHVPFDGPPYPSAAGLQDVNKWKEASTVSAY